ncbi:hypothetical protein P389DRAFT_76584 [Cystobasidium minutum MCA 4210]|uniref:uncharacterized protein n=1 Tax=Cystobasidium minutum MCA 4210 TaxID=1397322 RepID=UPI0034CE4ED3|eukprot:jgi/Rhomi1/76584/CE76583_34
MEQRMQVFEPQPLDITNKILDDLLFRPDTHQQKVRPANRPRTLSMPPENLVDSSWIPDHGLPSSHSRSTRGIQNNTPEEPRQSERSDGIPVSPTDSCLSTSSAGAGDPWRPPKRWVKGAKDSIKGVGPDWDSSDDEEHGPQRWRKLMREMDESIKRSRERTEKLKAECKRLDARIRARDVIVPYSIRKAHYKKEVKDDKRAEEARKKGIVWTPTVLTMEESEQQRCQP